MARKLVFCSKKGYNVKVLSGYLLKLSLQFFLTFFYSHFFVMCEILRLQKKNFIDQQSWFCPTSGPTNPPPTSRIAGKSDRQETFQLFLLLLFFFGGGGGARPGKKELHELRGVQLFLRFSAKFVIFPQNLYP